MTLAASSTSIDSATNIVIARKPLSLHAKSIYDLPCYGELMRGRRARDRAELGFRRMDPVVGTKKKVRGCAKAIMFSVSLGSAPNLTRIAKPVLPEAVFKHPHNSP